MIFVSCAWCAWNTEFIVIGADGEQDTKGTINIGKSRLKQKGEKSDAKAKGFQ